MGELLTSTYLSTPCFRECAYTRTAVIGIAIRAAANPAAGMTGIGAAIFFLAFGRSAVWRGIKTEL